ncbi:uncharacterized protein [Lepeophtheirus salmonis]|uniref:BTB domain-containing protein n=3 Tax=Lepeophtheirus salmonis TaxID=72036 RepID=A0A0K2UQ82_LEPSM|nr:uncharacterized protein LOC121126254 isoform X2 [Lepeophtheirus salmonis]
MDEGNHCMSINYKTPVENAKEILLVNAYTDLIFCFSDGRRLRAHKVILSEFSPLIRKICSEHSPLSEIYISIDEEEYESLNIILSLIYVGYSSTCITETSFFEVQDTACSLNITLTNVTYFNPSLSCDSYETPEDYEDYFIDEYIDEEECEDIYLSEEVSSHPPLPQPPLLFPKKTTSLLTPKQQPSFILTSKKEFSPPSSHVCPKCSKEFERKSRLREHFAVHYSFEIESEAVNCGIYSREHKYFCLICKKKLRDNRIFSYHMGYVHKLLLPQISNDPILVSKLFNLKVPINSLK